MLGLNLDRLHDIIERGADHRQAGKTTALLYKMLGCAELGEPDTFWLFITSHGWHEADRVMREFSKLLALNNLEHSVDVNNRMIIVNDKRFLFYTVENIERRTMGIRFEAVFDDVDIHILNYQTYQQYMYVKEWAGKT